MKIRVLHVSAQHETKKQDQTIERRMESRRIERLQKVLAIKLGRLPSQAA